MAKRPTKVAHRAAKPAHSANVAHSGEGDTDPASTKVERRVPTPEREREAGTADTSQEAHIGPPNPIPVEGDILPPERPKPPVRKTTGKGRAKKKKSLTVKQAKFVANMIVMDGNKTQAALAAGYGNGNPHTASAIAHETLQNPVVSEAIAKMRLRVSERLDASAATALNRLMHAAEQANVEGRGADEIRALLGVLRFHAPTTKTNVNVKLGGNLQQLDELMARVRSR
jgi:hypothetical protein